MPHQAGLSAFLALTPQVSYSDLAFLDDKIRWIKVSGSFVAEGGERYLAIGNFNNDSNTDTISVPNGGSLVNQPEGYWDEAGYFIDDVSVIPDSIYLGTNDFEEGKVKLNLYPNPASTSISISHNGIHKAISISFYTAAGQLIKSESWRKEIGVADLPNGLYLIKAEFENGAIGTKRLLIQR
ncbi:MAG: T9SS type A sorting domain-containing protein [Flavobacteriales bacterium]